MPNMPDEVSTVIVAAISSIITTLAMGYARRPQTLYEQKAVVVGEIIRDHINEIQIMRDILMEAEGLENTSFLESGDIRTLSFRDRSITLHVLLDAQTTFQIALNLNSRLVAASRVLGCKSHANLMCLCQLLNEIGRLGKARGLDGVSYRSATLDGAEELKQLIRRCDSCLVDELNKKRARFSKRTGVIWKTTLKLERRKYNKCLKRFDILFEEYGRRSARRCSSCQNTEK